MPRLVSIDTVGFSFLDGVFILKTDGSSVNGDITCLMFYFVIKTT